MDAYRQKPYQVQATQWSGTFHDAERVLREVRTFGFPGRHVEGHPAYILIPYGEGSLPVILMPGDWVLWDGRQLRRHESSAFWKIFEPVSSEEAARGRRVFHRTENFGSNSLPIPCQCGGVIIRAGTLAGKCSRCASPKEA